ncbi:MAG TPA: EAL domain-containing protein [Steroidobacteraceae bacterium]|nr:EAL domain-containing protein [Steroidobacteraceae bacterium]
MFESDTSSAWSWHLRKGPLVLAGAAVLSLIAILLTWARMWSHRLALVGSGALDAPTAARSMWLASALLLALLVLVLAVLTTLWLRLRQRTSVRDSRYRAVLEQSPNGMLISDAATLRIIDSNPALLASLGYSLVELREMTLPQLFTDDGLDDAALFRKLRDPDPRLPIGVRQLCRDGARIPVEATGHRLMLDDRHVLAYTISDVSHRRKVEAQLLEKQQRLDHLAHHDQLTGLPNRLYLAHRLPGAIEEARRHKRMLAVLFLDLDRFKHINDSRGHEVGDQLLKTVAERVRATVRQDDIVVRMGGDEFIVILQSIRDPSFISEMASRINETLSAPVVVDGRPLVTTVSIGVSLFPRDGQDMGELLRHSDTAMYQAKDRGRNNFQLFSPIMARKLRERVAVETSLRNALQNGQLDVHYQPIIDIASKKVKALEALLRWKHPTQGYILPGRFIDIAEETGLIVPVGEFVLQRALEDMTRWRASGAVPVPIAVNVSAVQLQRSNLHEKILALTSQYEVSPSLLQLELTETAMFQRSEARADTPDAISRLREIGVRIAIDDFGTGYSSLSYLKQWHVDYLKIDRSFVRDLVTDMSDLAIVGAIVAIARHLNIKVVAEGIEGWQQLEKLRQLGCGLAQGFLLAKPAPAGQCRKLLNGDPLNLTDDSGEFETPDIAATGTLGASAG